MSPEHAVAPEQRLPRGVLGHRKRAATFSAPGMVAPVTLSVTSAVSSWTGQV